MIMANIQLINMIMTTIQLINMIMTTIQLYSVSGVVCNHFSILGRMWDLIVSVPDHCLSFYFKYQTHSLLINNEVRTHFIAEVNKDTSFYQA